MAECGDGNSGLPIINAIRAIDFDPRKSDEIFADRGFDLAYVARIFPAYVLEREDTRPYLETRYQAIGELLGDVFVLV
jgi:uncharacterized DUF497 family protein